ncbi:MAG: hypothetical protein HXX16_02605 [Bacteroidales bacterium]|nr:hypothetical protein [Bacteroidales bacterium]
MQENNENQIYYEASQTQKAAFIGHLYAKTKKQIIPFNVPDSIKIRNLNLEAIKKAFDILIQRHEIFRTTLLMVDGEVKQKVWDHDSSLFDVSIVNLKKSKDKEGKLNKLKCDFNQVLFKCDQRPWLRIKIIQLNENISILLLVAPHMITDVRSMQFIKKELSFIYKAQLEGESIDDSKVLQYKDYIAEINEILRSDKGEKHRLYWLNILRELPNNNLTTLFSNNNFNKNKSYKETLRIEMNECCRKVSTKMEYDFFGTVSFLKFEQGAGYSFIIDSQRLAILKRLVHESNANMSHIIIATFHLLLYKLTGERDNIIGICSNMRDRKELDNLIGCLTNTVLFRHKIEESVDLIDFIKTVYVSFIKTLRHQIYPFEKALYDSDVPLHRISNLFLNITSSENVISNNDNQHPIHTDNIGNPYFDINCGISIFDNIIEVSCGYKTSLFTKDTIDFIFSKYLELIDGFKVNSDKKIKDIRLDLSNKPNI